MSSIAHLFVAGGFVMYPLVIFLLFTLMIGIERIFLYRKFTKDLRRFNKVLEKNQSWIMLPSVLERDTEELGSLFARAIRNAKNYIGAPTIITGGVSEALVATATGLTVAIIALGFHSYCAAKVNDSVATLEHECGNILDAYNEEHDI
ncbi:MAG: MotA/TolQ/ExbB proton channel family protein [Veillonella sp.]|nr:MotA/TolQ/ExbB proton channel family protein [Veillonella sp.]